MEYIREIEQDCCGLTVEECFGNERIPMFCHYCGTKFEIEPERDPWLWKGCVCEVWNDNGKKQLYYYSHIGEINDEKLFISDKNNDFYISFNNHRVLGTPLDFAPDWATHIEIKNKGIFRFIAYKKNNTTIKESTMWLYWRNCPKHLLDMNLPIPDWARNGGTE